MGQSNELGRYGYLLQAMPRLEPADKNLAQQSALTSLTQAFDWLSSGKTQPRSP